MEGHPLSTKVGIVLISLALSLGFTGSGGAQEKYPAREITFITGDQAGGPSEVYNRALCNAASRILRQPIILLNKPGASYAVALVAVKNAKPDGYTIGEVPSGPMTAQLIKKKVPYDFINDFTFIMQNHNLQHGIVVQTAAPWKTIQEVIGYAKSNPGKVRVGVSEIGGGHHIVTERLAMKFGIKFNVIPLGTIGTLTNLLGGHVDVVVTASGFVPLVEAGQLRLLAVMGSEEKRMAQFPNVPTLKELYGIDMLTFFTLAGPKGLPINVVTTIYEAFKKAVEDPDCIKVAQKLAIPLVNRGPEEITKYVHETFDLQSDLIKKLGLRTE